MKPESHKLISLVEDIATEEASAHGWMILQSALDELSISTGATDGVDRREVDQSKLRGALAQLLESARRHGEPIGKEQISRALKDGNGELLRFV
jgi:hypothetical protein